jgi:hypothetical protein
MAETDGKPKFGLKARAGHHYRRQSEVRSQIGWDWWFLTKRSVNLSNEFWEANMKFVGFYWTLPVPAAGFISLSGEAEIAAQQSRTICYQREVIKAYVADESGILVQEVVFMDVRPDRATGAIQTYVERAARLCRQHGATLLYVDFQDLCGWRPHRFRNLAIEREAVPYVPVWPIEESIIIHGKPFKPQEHFRCSRMRNEVDDSLRRDIASKPWESWRTCVGDTA